MTRHEPGSRLLCGRKMLSGVACESGVYIANAYEALTQIELFGGSDLSRVFAYANTAKPHK